ncbi:MAG TPA: nickel-dependent hydrogenase large subunit [Coriobacteriia bacterium]|jgi:Ni,Fe-hydrogenase I large subunit
MAETTPSASATGSVTTTATATTSTATSANPPTLTSLPSGGKKVVIDPVTRIEGHLRVTCVVENGKVTDAWNTATQFRGFEIFMKDRDPRSCWQFAQRICGVCPTPHAHASVLATEHAMGLKNVPDGARLFRNMSEAAHIGYDHILWFYLLNAFDYVNVPNGLKAKVPATQPALKALQDTVRRIVESGQLGPFAGHWWDHPGYKNPPEVDLELTAHYLRAIEVQQFANDASAFMGGRFPMVMNYQPGGMINQPTIEELQYYKGQMSRVTDFVDNVMLPDLLTIAPLYLDLATIGAGHKNYLSWGIFDDESQDPYNRVLPRGAIFGGDLTSVQKVDPMEDVKIFTKSSYYSDSSGEGKHPLDAGQDVKFTSYPDLKGDKLPDGKYDWTQSARLGKDNRPMEVGPLAEVLVAYASGRAEVKALVDSTLAAVGAAGKPEILMSDLGRIAGRVLRAKLNSDFAQKWADDFLGLVKAGKAEVYKEPPSPNDGEGAGGWNAPRGALAHYIRIKGGKTSAYAAVPPTNWNLSPRDDNGVRGPLEAALIGTPVVDPTKPLEILRVVHTFDP